MIELAARYAVHDAGSPVIKRVITCHESQLQIQLHEGELAIEIDAGVTDESHYVVDGQVVARAVQPTPDHTWSWQSLEWVAPDAKALAIRLADELLARRAEALSSSDWTQVADCPLAPDARGAWAAYRQALRDLTKQPGWPMTVSWPVPPVGR